MVDASWLSAGDTGDRIPTRASRRRATPADYQERTDTGEQRQERTSEIRGTAEGSTSVVGDGWGRGAPGDGAAGGDQARYTRTPTRFADASRRPLADAGAEHLSPDDGVALAGRARPPGTSIAHRLECLRSRRQAQSASTHRRSSCESSFPAVTRRRRRSRPRRRAAAAG